MRAFAASSTKTTPADAVVDVAVRLRALGFRHGQANTCALAFATADVAADPAALSAALFDMLGVPFVGHVGVTVFHDVRLRERKSALAVLVLDGVSSSSSFAPALDTASPGDVAAALTHDAGRGRIRFLSVALPPKPPTTALDFLKLLDADHVRLAGALCVAGGGKNGDAPVSVLGGGSGDGFPEGPGIAMLDVGGDGVDVVVGVAQAARPLGPLRSVTAATQNIIQELDGRPAFEALLADLPASLRDHIPQLGGALCAGFGAEEGDALLMKNIVGLDPRTGAVAVDGDAKVGAEVVFSLRDQQAAREDLSDLLDSFGELFEAKQQLAKAFVVFDCLGRDSGLFGVQNHDVQQVLARFGTSIPVVGVAGGGELCTHGSGTHLFGMSCVVVALM